MTNTDDIYADTNIPAIGQYYPIKLASKCISQGLLNIAPWNLFINASPVTQYQLSQDFWHYALMLIQNIRW